MFRLKSIICFNEVSESDNALLEKAKLKVYTIQQVIEAGLEAKKAGKEIKNAEPTQDDTFLISYTSGTTGDPKGVKLSHKNMIGTNFAGCVRLSHSVEPPCEDDCLISYLPLAHVFEQGMVSTMTLYGAKIGFFSGNVLKLTEDMQVLKPTVFPSVPRLYNRIYGRIMD